MAHSILLMKYQKKLESVGLSNTADLSDSDRKVIFMRGEPIIPISQVISYAQEATIYAEAVAHLYKNFKDKSIKEAKDYCKEKKLNYSVLTD